MDGSGDGFDDECPSFEFCWSPLFRSPPSPTNHAQRPWKRARAATAERQTCETFGRLIAHTFNEAQSTLRPASCQTKVSTNRTLSLTLGCNILVLFISLFVFLLFGISWEFCPWCLLPAACKKLCWKMWLWALIPLSMTVIGNVGVWTAWVLTYCKRSTALKSCYAI